MPLPDSAPCKLQDSAPIGHEAMCSDGLHLAFKAHAKAHAEADFAATRKGKAAAAVAEGRTNTGAVHGLIERRLASLKTKQASRHVVMCSGRSAPCLKGPCKGSCLCKEKGLPQAAIAAATSDQVAAHSLVLHAPARLGTLQAERQCS